MIQNKNIKLILNYSCGPLVFCVLLYSITNQLHQQADWQSSLLRLHSTLSGNGIMQLITVAGLMFINWGIEAMKWKMMMTTETPVSFKTSLRAVFAGNALAFFMPNRTGEYFGRMLYLRKQNRLKSIALSIVCSYAQILVTLMAGLVGILYMKDRIAIHLAVDAGSDRWITAGIGMLMVLTLFLTILYFNLAWVNNRVKESNWLSQKLRRILVLEHVNATILLSVLSLSVIRYLVFIVQYFLLFRVFGVKLEWWQAFWSVSVLFLVIAVVPSLGFLSEVGIRWKAAIQFIQLYSSNITGIFATSMAIWIINLVIPALIGGALILALKFFGNKMDCNQTGFT